MKHIDEKLFQQAYTSALSAKEFMRIIGRDDTHAKRDIKQIDKYFNCDVYSQIIKNKKLYELNKPTEIHICKNCGNEFTEKYSKDSDGNFCCKECARSYSSKIKREEINKKVSLKLKAKALFDYNLNPHICQVCGENISFGRRHLKTCCKKCSDILKSKNLSKALKGNPKSGGYRRGSTRGKHGYYKGIYCDSTYELAYLIYCLDHNIDIKRCEETFDYEYKGKKHKYHPDFIVNEEIIEIKNFYKELNDIKLKAVNKPIKILYEDDLRKEFEYVAQTYNKKYRKKWNNFYELYENYKPKYEYICDCCGKTFYKNKKVKTYQKFCSCSCSGKFRANANHKY